MGARFDGEQIVFTYADPDRRLSGVRLQQDVRLPGELLSFTSTDAGWALSVPAPGVDRMEYAFELQSDAGSEWVCDPDNDERVGGAFGDKSVLLLPSYCAPDWLAQPAVAGPRREMSLSSQGLTKDVPAVVWTSTGASEADVLPLLVAHDGPEYDTLARLTHFLDVMVEQGRLPGLRAALLAPVDRNETYAASPTYGRSLALSLLPGLTRELPTDLVIGMGASLGGLAMLQAQRTYPGAFDGLYLQSSSFFHRVLDEQESGFARFARIAAFVDGVLRAGTASDPLPVVMTCGLLEENVENNRLVTSALQAQGYDTRLVENRDVHTYTGWRDTFDPHLVDLVHQVLATRNRVPR